MRNALKLHRSLLIALVMVGLGLIGYLAAIRAPFYLDDELEIVSNQAIRHLWQLNEIFLYNPARFLGFLSFALNYHIHSLDVVGYRIVNILLHIANAYIVFLLSDLIFRAKNLLKEDESRQKLAFIASLIFLCHPIQTNAVTYITQRLTALQALFFLLTCFNFAKYLHQSQQKDYFRAIVFAVLAFFCKQNSATLALIAPSLVLLLKGRDRTGFIRSLVFVPLALLPFIFTYFFMTEESKVVQGGGRFFFEASPIMYFFTQQRVFFEYFQRIFFLNGFRLEYDIIPYQTLSEPSLWGYFAANLAIGSFAFYHFVRFQSLWAWGILFYYITISPDSSFVSLTMVATDHRNYLPMVGIVLSACQCAAWLFTSSEKIWRPDLVRKLATWLVIMGISFLLLRTIQRNQEWADAKLFWSKNAELAPRSPRTLNALGLIYLNEKNLDEAQVMFEKVLSIDPFDWRAYNNIGLIQRQRGQMMQALQSFEKAAELKPDELNPLINIGGIYIAQKEFVKGAQIFARAIEVAPFHELAHLGLVSCTEQIAPPQEALLVAENSLQRVGEQVEIWHVHARMLIRLKRYDEALDDFDKILSLEPQNQMALAGKEFIISKEYLQNQE